ncbi:hypothetical protein ABH930_000928 [Kitasatospora sp. GAS204A]|nr:hypothetical protein [Kitasatospora sp. GAS204B]
MGPAAVVAGVATSLDASRWRDQIHPSEGHSAEHSSTLADERLTAHFLAVGIPSVTSTWFVELAVLWACQPEAERSIRQPLPS